MPTTKAISDQNYLTDTFTSQRTPLPAAPGDVRDPHARAPDAQSVGIDRRFDEATVRVEWTSRNSNDDLIYDIQWRNGACHVVLAQWESQDPNGFAKQVLTEAVSTIPINGVQAGDEIIVETAGGTVLGESSPKLDWAKARSPGENWQERRAPNGDRLIDVRWVSRSSGETLQHEVSGGPRNFKLQMGIFPPEGPARSVLGEEETTIRMPVPAGGTRSIDLRGPEGQLLGLIVIVP